MIQPSVAPDDHSANRIRLNGLSTSAADVADVRWASRPLLAAAAGRGNVPSMINPISAILHSSAYTSLQSRDETNRVLILSASGLCTRARRYSAIALG